MGILERNINGAPGKDYTTRTLHKTPDFNPNPNPNTNSILQYHFQLLVIFTFPQAKEHLMHITQALGHPVVSAFTSRNDMVLQKSA